MATRRTYASYNDGCAAAHALDLIGDRWTMIVVRELLLGPKRFAQLQRDVLGIGPTVLTQRLQHLERHGIAVRHPLPAPAGVDVYELTERGLGLESVNTALALWATSSPELPRDADMSPDTLVLAMRAHARPVADLAEPVVVDLGLVDSRRAGAEPVAYRATIGAGGTSVTRADARTPASRAAAELTAPTRALTEVLIGGRPWTQADGVEVTGDSAAVDALVLATSLHA